MNIVVYITQNADYLASMNMFVEKLAVAAFDDLKQLTNPYPLPAQAYMTL